jgi:hypothetical protein
MVMLEAGTRPGGRTPRRREPVSVVTVFNDPAVRESCLDRSIEAHRDDALDVDYVPVSNVDGAFASAGAALNHGVGQSRHEYVVFVHQDVYLHSLTALEMAAGMLAEDETIGLLGAIGVTADGRFFGQLRDRVILLGDPAAHPAPVDCVDEALFIVPRRLLEREPLTEDPNFAWHAYAVEYGLRARAQGLRVRAVDIPLTHNSLTVNLDRLDVAYAALAASYPGAMPVMTPQGLVGGPARARDRTSFLSAHRWRYRWLRESRDARAGSRAAGGSPCILADIRMDVDELLAHVSSDPPLLIVNVDHHGSFVDARPAPLSLMRAGLPIRVASATLAEVPATVTRSAQGGPALVTNLDLEGVELLSSELPRERRIVGFRTSIGYWMLTGVSPESTPDAWRSRRATPLGSPGLGAA